MREGELHILRFQLTQQKRESERRIETSEKLYTSAVQERLAVMEGARKERDTLLDRLRFVVRRVGRSDNSLFYLGSGVYGALYSRNKNRLPSRQEPGEFL